MGMDVVPLPAVMRDDLGFCAKGKAIATVQLVKSLEKKCRVSGEAVCKSIRGMSTSSSGTKV